MQVKLIKGRSLPIGVDLGTHCIKMAQVRLVDGQYELLAASSRELPDDARKNPALRAKCIADAFRELPRTVPFKSRECILSIPAETTFVQHLKMAKMPDDQFANALQWELQGKLPYDPSQAIIRYVIAGDIYDHEEVKREVVVLAASREVVESHVDLARRAKLDCVAVNVEPCAIVECFSRMFRRAEDAERAALFIDIGYTSTQVVVAHGPHLAFAKNLFIGASQFDRAVAEGLQIPLGEARQMRIDLQQGQATDGGQADRVYQFLGPTLSGLADEVTNCLRYYESVFHNRPVERVVFLGGQAHDKRLCQSLAQRLAMPAQIGDPLAGMRRAEGAGLEIGLDRRGVQPDWAVAIGLSLGAAFDDAAIPNVA